MNRSGPQSALDFCDEYVNLMVSWRLDLSRQPADKITAMEQAAIALRGEYDV